LRGAERLCLFKNNGFVSRENNLRNPIKGRDGARLGTEVYQDNGDFSAVVGIDRSWCVEHGHAMFRSKPRARAHLAFETLWNGERKSSWNRCACKRRQRDRLLKCCVQIHACCTGRLVAREWNHDVPYPLRGNDKRYVGLFGHERFAYHCYPLLPELRLWLRVSVVQL